jgi:membrane fusion protein (multidrug efflux system)
MGTISDALLVDQSTVQYDQEIQFVYVVDSDNLIHQRFIKTSHTYEDTFVVEKGLSESERVITEGMHKVRPGLQVTIVEDQSEPAETTGEGV